MNYAELANAGVHEQPVYEPGKPIEYVALEFGLDPTQIAKLASNENPFGASPKAIAAAQASLRVRIFIQMVLVVNCGRRSLKFEVWTRTPLS